MKRGLVKKGIWEYSKTRYNAPILLLFLRNRRLSGDYETKNNHAYRAAEQLGKGANGRWPVYQ